MCSLAPESKIQNEGLDDKLHIKGLLVDEASCG
jgi:hypothetical protein